MTRATLSPFTLVLFLCAAGPLLGGDAAAQTPIRDVRPGPVPARSLAGTGVIAGTVVSDEADPKPIRRATVTISHDDGGASGRTTVTDDAGRFAIGGLPSGRYIVTATKPAYLPTAYGSTRPLRPGSVRTGVAIPLADGQQVPSLTLRLMKSSVLTGTIRDEEGRPARGVAISVMYFARAAQTGARTLTRVPGADGNLRTDSLGTYRIYGLPPGEYVVAALPNLSDAVDVEMITEADVRRASAAGASTPAATPMVAPPAARVGLVPIYYPGTPRVESASPISIAANQVREGIDFSLQFVPNVTVEGTVTGLTGAPAANATVIYYSQNSNQADMGRFATRTDAQGRFSIRGVAPGAYLLAASVGADAWATTPLSVQGSDVETSIQLKSTVPLSGRLSSEAAQAIPAADLSRVRIRLIADSPPLPVAGGSYTVAVRPDGTFATAVLPGRYRFHTAGPAGWVVKSAIFGGRDVADSVLDVQDGESVSDAAVTLSPNGAQLSGRMIDQGGLAAPEYFVILFPEEPALWGWQARRIQQVRPARDGAFTFQNLPPGNYRLAAVTDLDQNEWFDPELLRALSGSAIAVTLADGDRRTQTIQIK